MSTMPIRIRLYSYRVTIQSEITKGNGAKILKNSVIRMMRGQIKPANISKFPSNGETKLRFFYQTQSLRID